MKVIRIFLIFIFLLNIQKNNTKSCSQTYCATPQSNCSSIDKYCSCQKNEKIICSTLNSTPMSLIYEKDYNTVGILGHNNHNQSVSDVITFFSPYIASVNPAGLFVTQLCNNSVPRNTVKCKSMSLSLYTTTFDFNNLPISPSHFYLTDNCLKNISGNTSKPLQNAQFINLTGNYFTQMPSFKYQLKKLVVFSMESNFINAISRDEFKLMKSLQFIYLSGNCLSSIAEDTFYDLTQLKELHLQHNNLSFLPATLMHKNVNLKELHLQHNNLSFLPATLMHKNVNLKELHLQHNNLSFLPATLMHKNVNLEELDLSYNQLEEISVNFFQNNRRLYYINLSNNKLNLIKSGTFDSTTKLINLNLNFNHLTSLPNDLLKFAFNFNSLYLSYNNFKRLPILLFKSHNKNDIHLDHNNIEILDLPVTKRITNAKVLDLSHNCIKNLKFYNLTETDTTNDIEGIYTFICSNCCLTNDVLPTILVGTYDLALSQNKISKLNVTVINQRKSRTFRKLDVTSNLITEIVFEKESALNYNKSDVKPFIDFESNPIVCDCKLIPFISYVIRPNKVYDFNVNFNPDVYCNSPNELKETFLKHVDWKTLYCNITENCPQLCRCFEYAHKNYITVNCSSTGLNEFPMQFQYMPYDVIVDLKFNNIITLPSKNSSIWNKIQGLDLSHNKIRSIANLTVTSKLIDIRLNDNLLTNEKSIQEIFNNQNITRIVTLSGNPWQCNCDLINLRDAIIKSQSRLLDQNQLTCKFNKVQYGFDQLDQFCPSDVSDLDFSFRIGFPIVILVVVIICTLTAQFFRHKSKIQYYLFSKGWCIRFVSEDDVDIDKQYDAFISYSSLDGVWVRDKLVKNLEGENPKYKLCIHERDWPGGELIPDQIVRSVKESRRVIIVLTNNFLTSDWSLIEFSVAYQQSVNDRIRRLIVILPDEMPNLESAPDQLCAFLSTTTYLEANKSHFWNKLRCSMPRIRQ